MAQSAGSEFAQFPWKHPYTLIRQSIILIKSHYSNKAVTIMLWTNIATL